MSKKKFKGISTTTLHTANHENDNFSHTTPIYATSTFTFDSTEEGMERFKSDDKTRIYTRWGNPTFTAAQDVIAALEAHGIKNADGSPLELIAYLHSSGQAAMSTLFLSNLSAGDTLISHYSLYGGTQELMQKILKEAGIKTVLVDVRDLKLLEQTIKENPTTKLIHLETPANPTNHLFSLRMCSEIAKGLSKDENKVLLVVDNTYMGPIWQHPLELGADLVIYSATKYIAGHSDLIAGAVSGSKQLIQRVKVLRTFFGNLPSPNTGWLLMRSLETMKIRMEQQQANAKLIAQYLSKHPKVAKVYYLGLLEKGTAQWDIFNEQCKGEGAMLSFDIVGGEKEAFAFLNHLKLIQLAVSLGSTESLAEHPATMTHIDIPENEKKIMNITSSLVRLSVGVEHADDLIADIEKALEKV